MSSFQTKLFCLCTRALRGNRLHRPFRARGDRGYFSPFSPRPPTPGVPRTLHRPPAFHSSSPPNLLRQLPLPQIHSRALTGIPCSPRSCAGSSASSLPPLSFPTRGGPRLASHPQAYRCSNPRHSYGPAGFALRSMLVTALHRGEAYFLAIPLPISFRMFPNWL